MPDIWKYRLTEPLVHNSKILPEFGCLAQTEIHFADQDERLWLTIGIDGSIAIEPGYAWDGCSPTWKLFGWLLVGTPDGATDPVNGYPYTYAASCIHDALYQFLDDPKMPYTREQIDLIFRERLLQDQFPAAEWYYQAVHWFGRMYQKWQAFKVIKAKLGA